MTESEKRMRRCAFTGHRPEKLRADEWEVREILRREIVASRIADDINVFISGMARGVDMWAADTVLSLRESFGDLRLICAVPYKGFERSWSESDRREYERILGQADLVYYVCDEYSPDCFQRRNQWMVDHACRLVVIWSGLPGGTLNTMNYAAQKDISVIVHNV